MVTTALYRRYRPEAFGEMIGQSQVTDPLMTALRGDRVGHAYLFSGPRGCGKTTSARILARCLNCAEGPTDTPCGSCPSCLELSREGGGSLDVVEIDAASHGGVDDARDLRERAIFAPARDRYKIFIIDEAHMVTSGGFNALLKLVEEPPPHVKFIFATTEPEKVLGTIRSRTHHYPFRLVPSAAMLEYVDALCRSEGVEVEPGVLPLVVRAGGGSPRDTLSLLDQLIAGSDAAEGAVTVRYERAVSLLGYTHAALLDEIVESLAAADAAAAFPAVDRVVQTGQDPRRFVDDLLERLRDLIVIAAVGAAAAAVLHGRSAEELTRMREQAATFGADRLSRTADIVSAALDDMAGATSPRLQLELMVARVLADAVGSAPVAPRGPEATEAKRGENAASGPDVSSRSARSTTEASAPPGASTLRPGSGQAGSTTEDPPSGASASSATEATTPSEPVTFERLTATWPTILARLEKTRRVSWMAVLKAQPVGFDTERAVLTLGFPDPATLADFKGSKPGSGPSDDLRDAILAELGVRVKYVPASLPAADQPSPAQKDSGPRQGGAARTASGPASRSANAAVAEWAVAPIPSGEGPDAAASPLAETATDPNASTDDDTPADADDGPPAVLAQLAVDDEPAEAEATPPAAPVDGNVDEVELPLPGDDEPEEAPAAPAAPQAGTQRYGEAVVRQVLGATFLREEPFEPPTKFA